MNKPAFNLGELTFVDDYRVYNQSNIGSSFIHNEESVLQDEANSNTPDSVNSESNFVSSDEETSTFSINNRNISADKLKNINREIIKKTSPDEIDKLFEERNILVQKKYDVGLTNKEKNQLTMVSWHLDRIEDAETAEHFDNLEEFVQQRESFAAELKELVDKLKSEKLVK